MSDSTLRERLLAYLQRRCVVTLATVGPDGPWSTPVFYASDGFRLYFVSDPATRHGQNIGQGARVAATVTEDHHEWTAIQGIQLAGTCRPVESAGDAAARTAFLAKYPFAVAFLDPNGPLYEKAGRKSVFYQLDPDGLWFTDNTRGFGSREPFTP